MKKLRSILTIAVLGAFLFTLFPNKAIFAFSWEGVREKIEDFKEGVRTQIGRAKLELKKLKLKAELVIVRRELQRLEDELVKAETLEKTSLKAVPVGQVKPIEVVPAKDVKPMTKAYGSMLKDQKKKVVALKKEMEDLLKPY